jgi:glutamine synthetase
MEDRSAFIRVKGGSPEDRHIENRGPSGLSNPYLASAGLLAAGILGITEEQELEPAARPPAEEDESKTPHPTTQEESLHLLESDQKLVEMLGDEFIKAYSVMRRYELGRLADHVTDWELQEYLELY